MLRSSRLALALLCRERGGALRVSAAARPLSLRASPPLLQKGGAGAKKGGGAPAAAAAPAETFDLAKVVPCQLLKEGADPELQPDEAYPDWVFRLTEDRPLLEDLVMRGLEHVEPKDMKRACTRERGARRRRVGAQPPATSRSPSFLYRCADRNALPSPPFRAGVFRAANKRRIKAANLASAKTA